MRPTRRQVAQGTAWSAPVIMVGSPATAMAASAACGAAPAFTSATSPTEAQTDPYWVPMRFSVLNVDTLCSFQITQLTAELKINTPPTDTTANGIWYSLGYEGQGQDGGNAPTVPGGQTISLTSTKTPFTVSPQDPEAKWMWAFDWGNYADNHVRADAGANVSVTYTMSGVDQHGQPWGPVVLVLDNNGAGYTL